jgi:hypothetical protein
MATNHYNKPRKSQKDSLETQAVLAIARGLWWLVSWPFKRLSGKKTVKSRKSQAVNVQEVSHRWQDIQTSVGLGGVTHFGSAIVAADKLLDHVLKQKGYAGETMGERLKGVQSDVSAAAYNGAWQAHKLRNRLVHEMGGEVMSHEVKEAIRHYEQILRELGALR